jgi:hypothetical protein
MILQPGSRPVPNCPDYVLIRKLGAGAFGEVWHATGPGGVDVALKFIRLDPQFGGLELRSLEVVKSIRHPNLVSLFAAWIKDSCLILAMEKCDRSLQDRLHEALEQNLPGIPLSELLNYMRDAANGLDALNAKQVQHRDVKPANLLLLDSGVKVADFGLAKALEQTVASNSGAGTVAYLAPECFKGQLTPQSDQYSLAVTYYQLRTGSLLFKGDQAQMMYAHLELAPNLSDLPLAERVVLARALSKEPDKRWRDCQRFVDELVKGRVATKAEEHEYKKVELRQEEKAQQWDTPAIKRKYQEEDRDWFVLSKRQESGPFSVEELKAKAAAGSIGYKDQVRKGHGSWAPAKEIDCLSVYLNDWVPTAAHNIAGTLLRQHRSLVPRNSEEECVFRDLAVIGTARKEGNAYVYVTWVDFVRGRLDRRTAYWARPFWEVPGLKGLRNLRWWDIFPFLFWGGFILFWGSLIIGAICCNPPPKSEKPPIPPARLRNRPAAAMMSLSQWSPGALLRGRSRP